MVEMALTQLDDKKQVDFDEERKAVKITNLMVVLCSNRSINPVVTPEL